MVYLLDASLLIQADEGPYPMVRFPVFWDWLAHQVEVGRVRIPVEIYEEITRKKDDPLYVWLHTEPVASLLKDVGEVRLDLVQRVVAEGYAPDLTEDEVSTLGRDPFLIAHCLADSSGRCVVTNEVSKPGKRRANRRIPDVCQSLGVSCVGLRQLIDDLDFSTNWVPK